jgi:hypothetical protein
MPWQMLALFAIISAILSIFITSRKKAKRQKELLSTSNPLVSPYPRNPTNPSTEKYHKIQNMRDKLRSIHDINLSAYTSTTKTNPPPRDIIFAISKSSEEAIEALECSGMDINRICFSVTRGREVPKTYTLHLSVEIVYCYEGLHDSVCYFYNAPKNYKYYENKMLEMFMKLKEKNPHRQFVIYKKKFTSFEKLLPQEGGDENNVI